MTSIRENENRFFDGDQEPGSEMCIILWRAVEHAEEQWKMVRRIGYVDRQFAEPFRVPKDKETFRTDLTSVPQIFSWLVPKTGTHLPAALLHDGLVVDEGDLPTHDGPPITRIQADRIFRDAMADQGTPIVRRWLIWAAVTLASAKTVRPRLLMWLMYALIPAIVILGTLATLDLFDVIDWVPWMGARPWYAELGTGLLGAVVGAAVLAIPWALARLYRAGFIAGLALATLLHVTVAVAAVTVAYLAVEKFAEWVTPNRVKPPGKSAPANEPLPNERGSSG